MIQEEAETAKQDAEQSSNLVARRATLTGGNVNAELLKSKKHAPQQQYRVVDGVEVEWNNAEEEALEWINKECLTLTLIGMAQQRLSRQSNISYLLVSKFTSELTPKLTFQSDPNADTRACNLKLSKRKDLDGMVLTLTLTLIET